MGMSGIAHASRQLMRVRDANSRSAKAWPRNRTKYSYDLENHLLTANGAYNATLTYDPLGHLFQVVSGSSTTQFLYDGDELIAEYDGSGTLLRRYVHGPQTDDPLVWYEGSTVSSATRRTLQPNYQGSIESIADASGKPIGVDRYDEYGVPATSNLGRFQYTGQAWLSALGLYYYKARFYDPRLGRFLQTDPVGYRDDLDLYAYVGNDPLNHSDPMGLKCETGSNGPSCQFDEFRDKKGNSISREQATRGGNWLTRALKIDPKSRVARQEAQMTDKYKKALAMKDRGGSVTVKGNAALGVVDQTISGDRIVNAMETTKLVESAQPNNINAAETAKWAATGAVRDITFYGNGTLAPFEQSFGHEELHSGYMWTGSDQGWDTPGNKYQEAHQKPFNDASDAIQ
jgi:RHS repeat-associated protein